MNKLKSVGVVVAVSFAVVLAVSVVVVKADGPRFSDFGNFWQHIKVQHRAAVCSNEGSDGVHCNAQVVVDAQGVPQAAVAPTVGYTPAQFHSAYNVPTKAAGSPLIAIVDAYDDANIASDLATYSSAFGIPAISTCRGSITNSSAACFEKVDQTGGSHYPASDPSWDLEISLDVEVAHAMCQNCRILLVEAKSANYTDLLSAVDRARLMGAKYISNSYGSAEFSTETSFDSHFKYPGIAFTFSAGDAGYGAEYPAASQYVTAVGGTTLALGTNNTYGGEVAWSGTGSGCSAYETKPTWQKDPGCVKRTVADVSADADPSTGAAIYDSVRYLNYRGWFQVGGTSLSSPLIAATYALAGNVPATRYANSLPYATSTASALNDVASGTNGSCGGLYLCTAGVGYDGPTGLGSPQGLGAF